MKNFQSVLCALALAISLSSTVFAGDIHGKTSIAPGDIHGIRASGILLTDFYGDITGVIVSILGDIHG